jgi:regulation of enolase protein 1 (concanavalin A-like superfamily)
VTLSAQTQSGTWQAINTTYDATTVSKSVFRLSVNHGVKPSAGAYAYTIAPARTASEMAIYQPAVGVLRNDTAVQAVRSDGSNVTAAVFWEAGGNTVNGITAFQKAAILRRVVDGVTELAVSDPTQANTSLINVELAQPAYAVVSADPGVTVTQLMPTVKVSVAVSGASGRTFSVKLLTDSSRGPLQTVVLDPEADAYVYDAAPATNYGTASELICKAGTSGYNRESYLRFNLSRLQGTPVAASLRLVPTLTQTPGTHAVALVSNNAWAEGAISWATRPQIGAPLATWVPAANVPVEVSVLPAVQRALSSNGLVSLAVYGWNEVADGYTAYGSRESSATRPQLVLKFAGIPQVPPTVVLDIPTAPLVAGRSMVLAASVTPGTNAVAGVTFLMDGVPLGTAGAAPFAWVIPESPGGSHRFEAVATDHSGLRSNTAILDATVFHPPTAPSIADLSVPLGAVVPPLLFEVADPDTPASALAVTAESTNGALFPVNALVVSNHALAWNAGDIGAVAATGSTTVTGQEIRIVGSGADIWGTADEFQFYRHTWSGDFEVTVRVLGQDPTDPFAKAGIMVRASELPGSINAYLAYTVSNGVTFQRRAVQGGSTVSTKVAGVAAPGWLRLRKTGNSFRALYAADSAGQPGPWLQVGTDSILAVGSPCVVGLAVTSHNDGVLNHARFDRLTGFPNRSLALSPATGQIGSAIVTVRVTDGVGESNTQFLTEVTGTADQWWRQSYFGSALPIGLAGDFADPDGDGLLNYVERVLGTNPTRPSQAAVVSKDASGIAIRFQRDSRQTDVLLAIVAADGMSGPWVEIARSTAGGAMQGLINGIRVVETGVGNGLLDVVVTDERPKAAGQRYLRVRASR